MIETMLCAAVIFTILSMLFFGLYFHTRLNIMKDDRDLLVAELAKTRVELLGEIRYLEEKTNDNRRDFTSTSGI